MLAKRFIVAAFAAFFVLALPLLLTGNKSELFRDTPEGLLTTTVAAAPVLTVVN
jgi:hypothetical protein